MSPTPESHFDSTDPRFDAVREKVRELIAACRAISDVGDPVADGEDAEPERIAAATCLAVQMLADGVSDLQATALGRESFAVETFAGPLGRGLGSVAGRLEGDGARAFAAIFGEAFMAAVAEEMIRRVSR